MSAFVLAFAVAAGVLIARLAAWFTLFIVERIEDRRTFRDVE